MWVQSLGRKDTLEEEMATHSSIPVREIPCAEEPEGLHPWRHKELDMTEHTCAQALLFLLHTPFYTRNFFMPLLKQEPSV